MVRPDSGKLTSYKHDFYSPLYISELFRTPFRFAVAGTALLLGTMPAQTQIARTLSQDADMRVVEHALGERMIPADPTRVVALHNGLC